MKNTIFLILLIFVFVNIQCKTDTKVTETSDTIEVEESTLSEPTLSSPIAEEMNATKTKEVNFEQKEVKLTEVKDVKREEKKQEIKKELKEKSANKGKSCDDILTMYKSVVEEYITSKNLELLKKLPKSNDIIFNNCRKEPSFKKEIDALDEKMASASDDEDDW